MSDRYYSGKHSGNYRNKNRNYRNSGRNRNSGKYRKRKRGGGSPLQNLLVVLLMAVLAGVIVLCVREIRTTLSGRDKVQTQVTSGEDAESSAAETAEDTEEASAEETGQTGTEESAEAPVLQKGLYAARSGAADSFFEGYDPVTTENTIEMPEEDEDMKSTNAVLVDLDTGEIVAQKHPDEIISPASMTKILTLLTASEHLTDLQDTYAIGIDITDYTYRNDCSVAGFEKDEPATIQDLLYGMILPSGADAALAITDYVAGSQEAFNELMNAKVAELGRSSTAHFDNSIGVYSEQNYCTVTDMAMILKAAEENELCYEILGTRQYTTGPTSTHPEGLELSNWFLRKIEDKDTNGYVAGGKTGFVEQSMYCAASYLESESGKHYICVTVGSTTSWRCIYDHVTIYSRYAH